MNITLLREAFGEATFSPDDVARLLGVAQANNQVSRWKQQGLLRRVGRGRYQLAHLSPARVAPTTRRRDPPKQRLLAEMARRRWRDWVDRGRVEPTGARSYRYRIRPMEAPRVRVRRL